MVEGDHERENHLSAQRVYGDSRVDEQEERVGEQAGQDHAGEEYAPAAEAVGKCPRHRDHSQQRDHRK